MGPCGAEVSPRNDNDVDARISYRDNTNRNSYMAAGEALSVSSASTKATVTYTGPVGEGDDRWFGFNVACYPLENSEIPA